MARRAAATAPGSSGGSDGDDASREVTRRARRPHPARKSRAAALGLSLASSTAMSIVFAYSDRSPAAATLASVAAVTPLRATVSLLPTTAAVATATPPPLVAPTIVPTTTKKKLLATAGATFNGAVSINRWGPVQVQITVTNGKITKVTALQTPSDKSKSVRINNRAVPILRSEALAAQSAQVNTVSGATYTSDSYAASLQSAIDSARSAGVSVA